MLETYKNTQKLRQYLLKLPKNESSFLYFLLEAHDNLCFYSTTPHVEGDQFRCLLVYTPIEFQADLDRLWESLKEKLNLEVLETKTVLDEKLLPA